MKLFSKSLLVSVAALAFAPTSALAMLPDCDISCHAPMPCYAQCTNPFSYNRTTCGTFLDNYGSAFPDNSCVRSASAAPESSCDAELTDSAEDAEAVCLEPSQSEER